MGDPGFREPRTDDHRRSSSKMQKPSKPWLRCTRSRLTAVATFTVHGRFLVRHDEATVAYLLHRIPSRRRALNSNSRACGRHRAPRLCSTHRHRRPQRLAAWKAFLPGRTWPARRIGCASTTTKSSPRRRSNPSLVWSATARVMRRDCTNSRRPAGWSFGQQRHCTTVRGHRCGRHGAAAMDEAVRNAVCVGVGR